MTGLFTSSRVSTHPDCYLAGSWRACVPPEAHVLLCISEETDGEQINMFRRIEQLIIHRSLRVCIMPLRGVSGPSCCGKRRRSERCLKSRKKHKRGEELQSTKARSWYTSIIYVALQATSSVRREFFPPLFLFNPITRQEH